MLVLYRMVPQPTSEPKPKLKGASKLACLRNFLGVFSDNEIIVSGDCLDDAMCVEINNMNVQLIRQSFHDGPKNFMACVHVALARPDEERVYLVEDDFLHRPEAAVVLAEGFELNAEYVTLYDHPDKYREPGAGGNPLVEHGGEATKVFLGRRSHWKYTNSTVMTFATRVGQLRRNLEIVTRRSMARQDHEMFRELGRHGVRVVSSLPGHATHTELAWLSPLFDWNSVLEAPDKLSCDQSQAAVSTIGR